MKKGFTLIEILVVMSLIGILAMMVLPTHQNAITRAKEAVLKENLLMIRDAIEKYYFDKHKYPVDFEELVTSRYLRDVPLNPLSKKREWEPVFFEMDDTEDFDPELAEGIVDVKSTYKGTALDGTEYGDW